MQGERIVLVGREVDHTHLLYNALTDRYDVHLIYEEPPGMGKLLKWRLRNVGWWKVLNQLAFQFLVATPMQRLSAKRQAEIVREAGASTTRAPQGKTTRTASVNSRDLLEQMKKLAPRAVVINGTRILTGSTLKGLGVPVVNIHAGITPRYRGVHGGYWALVQQDPEHCGVTVHLVDEGVDTGPVLHQGVISPGPKDNFTTYPWLQAVAGCRLLLRALDEIMGNAATPLPSQGESTRWYHPTLWEYLWHRLAKGVK